MAVIAGGSRTCEWTARGLRRADGRDRAAGSIGTPDDLVAAIHRFDEATGGYGGLLIQAHEWATREKTLKSYELLARYVMPRFQGSLVGIGGVVRLVARPQPGLSRRHARAPSRARTRRSRTGVGGRA